MTALIRINGLTVDGPFVTRFPPEPSGYMHIGHLKAALLNFSIANTRPGGHMILRFDDTNPSKEKMEYQDAIKSDLHRVHIIPEKVSHSSDYFDLMYQYALQLIKDGKGFADDTILGKGNDERKSRLPSKNRDMSTVETLAHFATMKSGSPEGTKWCIRARINYSSSNGAMRDPVIYRCNNLPHHRTGTTWHMYPTYDFCAPILDSVEGVTLALRTNEYRDRDEQYAWFQDSLGLRRVPIQDFSRLNFVRTVLSKRKLTKIVDSGLVHGWDDPRMPTVRGILRRGITVNALTDFVLSQGASKNVLMLQWGALWALNKSKIDPVAPRYTAITRDGAVLCEVQGIDSAQTDMKPTHARNKDLGMKVVHFTPTILIEANDASSFLEGQEITLMNWGNACVRNITRDSLSGRVDSLCLHLNIGGDVKGTKKITWLASIPDNLVPIELLDYGHLITKDKLDKNDELDDFLAKDTEIKTECFADCNVKPLGTGAVIQFDRKGYYRLDSVDDQCGKMVFIKIPSK